MSLTFHFYERCLNFLARVALVLLLFPLVAVAETIELNPDRDNTLYERVDGDLSNGIGPSLFFGQTGVNANEVLRRALLRFDLSSIPPGSTIQNVSLAITVDLVPPGATGFNASLHRVLSNWGEGASFAPGPGGGGGPSAVGDATWIHTFFDGQFWTTPGGDFEMNASATTSLNNGTGPFTFMSTPDLVADVQTWVNQPAQNFGWMILGEEDNPQNARRIGSRENASTPPVLLVEFEPAPELPEARPVPVLSNAGLWLMVLAMLTLASWAGIRLRS